MKQKCTGVLVVMRQKWKRVHMYIKKGFKDKKLLGGGVMRQNCRGRIPEKGFKEKKIGGGGGAQCR